MSNYLYNGEALYEYSRLLRELNNCMQNSYNMALNLQSEIENTNSWSGESHDAMVAFLDLLIMFHNKLSINSPIEAAIEEYEKLYESLCDFYSSFKELLNMNKI